MNEAVAVAPPDVRRTPVEARRLAGTGVLSAAMTGSGILAYAFHVVAARSLGPEAYGQIAVLWAAMFLAVVIVFRPLEQTTARAISDRVARHEEITSVIRTMALVYAVMVVVGAVIAVAAWSVIARSLFLGSDLLTAALVAGVAGYGIAYVVRGVCAGMRWFDGYGAILVADAVVRLLVAAPLLLVASKAWAAAACAAAGVAGAAAPLLWCRRRISSLREDSPGSRFEVRSAVSFAAPAAVIAAADQVLVNGGPLLVVLGGGSSEAAGVVFAATMLVRVPVYIFQGVAASLLPSLTRLQAVDERRAFKRVMAQVVSLLAIASIVIACAAALVGPEAIRHVYGPEFAVTRVQLGLLGVGVGAYLAAATFSQGLLALDRARPAALIWATAASVFLVSWVALPGPALLRIAAGFALAATGAALSLGVDVARRVRSIDG